MPEVDMLNWVSERKVYNLAELVYRAQLHQAGLKDHEFSLMSVEDHRRAGYQDTVHAPQHPEALERPRSADGVFILDAQDLHQ